MMVSEDQWMSTTAKVLHTQAYGPERRNGLIKSSIATSIGINSISSQIWPHLAWTPEDSLK